MARRLDLWAALLAAGLALASAFASPLAHAADAPATAAATPREAAAVAANPALEAQVMALSAELRCLVCQNQTIADSHAELAVDLRRQIREMLTKGQGEREILDYMTQRYGDFVLYRPPFKPTTVLLWLGPALLLVVALGSLVVVLRRRDRLADDAFEPDTDSDERETAPDVKNR
ncbi:cytochrome c-type biogenesis protein [Ideonella sp. A 288]|uniref:cytochrome c-type biogenesis protein n=1 Tax=Ideonella sp. A 288 TaxID=1962181 RepID=UPI000B4B9F67|nr:cytochrome c-type biogenesis protein [Ideonella sp. A 288]